MEQRNADEKHIGEKMFHPSDYEDMSELSQALATTHEQISDAYSAGTIDEVQFEQGGRAFGWPRSARETTPTE